MDELVAMRNLHSWELPLYDVRMSSRRWKFDRYSVRCSAVSLQ